MDNYLAQFIKSGKYPITEDEHFALMKNAGWTSEPQGSNFDPMATDSRLGNMPEIERQRNALETLFQGAVMAGDLDRAAKLANTPDQRALLDVAYAQRINDQDRRARIDAGKQYDAPTNLIGDYARAQEAKLARSRMEEDRQMKIQKFYGDQAKEKAQTNFLEERAKAIGLNPLNLKTPLSESEKAFASERGKLDAKELDDLRNAATKAQSGLARIQQMKELEGKGVYTGSFAEGRAGIANFFSTIGIPLDPEKLANTQEYQKHAKELTLNLLKEGVGANQISNADLKFVNETVPQLETSPEARKNLLNYIESRLNSSVDRFKKADEYATANNSLRGFIYQPEQAQQPETRVRKYNPATGKIE